MEWVKNELMKNRLQEKSSGGQESLEKVIDGKNGNVNITMR